MSGKSSIEWTDASWSPIRARVKQDAPDIARLRGYASLVQVAIANRGRLGPHCEKVSPACANCYSEANNHRCLPSNRTGLPFDRRARELVDIILDERILQEPLHWKKPRRIFVCSQTDLFGEFVPDEMIDRVFAVMALCPQHRFQCLTKRSERLLQWATRTRGNHCVEAIDIGTGHVRSGSWIDPIDNVWLGVSVESQDYLYRIDHLRQTPAAVRFLSLEPLLEDLGDISRYLRASDDNSVECSSCLWRSTERDALTLEDHTESELFTCPKCGEECAHVPLDELGPRIDWVIVGGESGKDARPMHPDWVRSIREQCVAAGVPFFFKQWGGFKPIGCADWRSPDYDAEMLTSEAERNSVLVHADGQIQNDMDEPEREKGFYMVPVGKKVAGRLLDGRTWDEMPEAKNAAH